MRQHGVEKRQELLHTRGQGDFFAFPRGEEPRVKSVALRVVARGHEGPHGAHRAHMRAPAPERAPTAEGPTGAMEGRHPDHGRALLPRARPQRGEVPEQRAGPHGPHARGTLPPLGMVPPQRAGPEPHREVVVQRGGPRMAPRPRGRTRLREARARPRQAVLRRGPQDDQLVAASQEGAQRLRLGVGPRPGRRADHGGTGGPGPGIPRLCVRQLARGPGTIPDLTRGPDDHGEACRGHGTGHRALQAAGGFQHHARGVEGLHPVHERRHPAGLVRDGPPCPSGAQGHVPLGCGHLQTATAWHVTPPHACPPDRAQTGALAPHTWTGSGSPGRDDPRSAPVSVDQGSIGLSRPGTA